jgi:hypothetical protein
MNLKIVVKLMVGMIQGHFTLWPLLERTKDYGD